MIDVQPTIYQRLRSLQPKQINITDHSHLHRGHVLNTGGGHFQLLIVSDAFTNLTRMERQRKIYQLLKDLFEQRAIHAISIKALTSSEYLAL